MSLDDPVVRRAEAEREPAFADRLVRQRLLRHRDRVPGLDGMTAVPSSIRVVARPMSATAVSASKSSGTWGTQTEAKPGLLGRLGVGDEPRRPSRGSGPAPGRS